jgi:hypothetical protein
MNLSAIVTPIVAAINPLIIVVVLPSRGYKTTDDGSRVPYYAEPYEVRCSVQAETYTNIVQTINLNLTGYRKTMYLSTPIDGIVRPAQKGGDLIKIPTSYQDFGEGSVWLIVQILEDWRPSSPWTKVLATLQDNA